MGLWQGPQEGIRVRMGPGLGGRVGAHLARSALRAGTAWQGLVSCAGSKKTEKEMGRRGGRTDTCSPLPTPYPGSREQTVLWSPQGTFESKTVRAVRNSIAHPTPSFYQGENPRLREVQRRAQSHTACQGREGTRKMHHWLPADAHPTPWLLQNCHLPFCLPLPRPFLSHF